jgi:hypothetical protein
MNYTEAKGGIGLKKIIMSENVFSSSVALIIMILLYIVQCR